MEKSSFSNIKQVPSLENADKTDYAGVNPLQALKNIKKRCQERKGRRQSGLKTALVLQGGGMRGVFSIGACCALQEIGYTEGFDQVYGVSSGALNGAYFLSGQAAYGATIYYQDINNKYFINLWRFRKIMDISFLMNIVVNVKPLNFKRLRSSSTLLNILLTQVSTGKAVTFTNRSGNTHIFGVLKATAAVPFAYDIPVTIDGVDYLDGGPSCPVPIEKAIDSGCTDILVVLTRPRDFHPGRTRGILDRCWIEPRIKKHGENFYRAFVNRHETHTEQLRITKGEKFYRGKKANIVALFPDKSLKIRRMTKSTQILKNTAIDGAVKALKINSPCL